MRCSDGHPLFLVAASLLLLRLTNDDHTSPREKNLEILGLLFGRKMMQKCKITQLEERRGQTHNASIEYYASKIHHKPIEQNSIKVPVFDSAQQKCILIEQGMYQRLNWPSDN